MKYLIALLMFATSSVFAQCYTPYYGAPCEPYPPTQVVVEQPNYGGEVAAGVVGGVVGGAIAGDFNHGGGYGGGNTVNVNNNHVNNVSGNHLSENHFNSLHGGSGFRR